MAVLKGSSCLRTRDLQFGTEFVLCQSFPFIGIKIDRSHLFAFLIYFHLGKFISGRVFFCSILLVEFDYCRGPQLLQFRSALLRQTLSRDFSFSWIYPRCGHHIYFLSYIRNIFFSIFPVCFFFFLGVTQTNFIIFYFCKSERTY